MPSNENTPVTSTDPVTIELVGAETYATLEKQFNKGDVFAVTPAQAEEMLAEDHPITGARLFAKTTKAAQVNSRNAPAGDPDAETLAMGERDTALESGNDEGEEAQSTAALSEQAEHKGPRKLVSGGPRNANLKSAVKPTDGVSV